MTKKFILILLIIFLVTGCFNKQNQESVIENIPEEVTTESTTTTTTTTTTTASTTTNITSGTTTSKKTTSKVTTTVQSTSVVTKESCTPKKFKNKYTYVYDNKYDCDHSGADDYYYLDDNKIIENLMFYGCEKIVDDCGDTYYGVYFTIWTGPGNDDYKTIHY